MVDVPLNSGSFSLTGYSGKSLLYLEPSTGSFSLTGSDIAITVGPIINLAAGGYTFAGYPIIDDTRFIWDVGSYALAGLALGVQDSLPIALDAGSYSLVGYSGKSILYLQPATGSFSFTGQSLGIDTSANTSVAMAAGGYSLNGLDIVVGTSVTFGIDAGVYTLTGLDSTFTQFVPLGSGSFNLIGADLDILTGAFGVPVSLVSGSFALEGFSGRSILYLEPEPGAFSLAGYAAEVVIGGASVSSPLNKGLFNFGGLPLDVGESLGSLTSNFDRNPEPDELDYILSTAVTGTLFWVITDSVTPPELVASPPGFATTGVLNGSIPITSSSGSVLIDTTSVPVGAYYIHAVAYSTGLRSFSEIETVALNLSSGFETGSFSLQGYNFAISDKITLPSGDFTVSGYDLGVDNTAIALGPGSFSLEGNSFDVFFGVPLDTGSFSFNGYPVFVSRRVHFSRGSYELLGEEFVIGLPEIQLNLNLGNFTWLGFDTNFTQSDLVPLNTGNFNFEGYSIGVYDSPLSQFSVGSFTMIGLPLEITLDLAAPPNFATPGRSHRSGVLRNARRSGTLRDAKRIGTRNP